ncbi:WxL domain-containing protein [Enterococcus crotali]|uniref:WxL domain-containing protein n=1 Tax=Enterococcus crotali TaxID=1453587 RepID=UPI00046F54E2|nr:WxL domain-containing protein [Enterococcus crotali]
MKTNKTTKLLSLGLISLCALSLGSPTVLAADPEANTKADVKFTEDTGTVDPEKPEVTDPTDPDKEPGIVDPGGEGGGGNGTKSFNINWVSNFKFGEIKIAGSTMSAYAQPTTLNWAKEENGDLVPTGEKTVGLANFLQVTDNTGKNAGWTVNVTGTPFYELDASGKEIQANELAGAAITLEDPQIVGLAESADLAPISTLSPSKDILDGGANKVFEAASQKGQGTWSLTWGADTDKTSLKGITVAGNTTTGKATSGVKLTVPVTAKPKAEKSYRSSLEWVLTTAP